MYKPMHAATPSQKISVLKPVDFRISEIQNRVGIIEARSSVTSLVRARPRAQGWKLAIYACVTSFWAIIRGQENVSYCLHNKCIQVIIFMKKNRQRCKNCLWRFKTPSSILKAKVLCVTSMFKCETVLLMS